jgi:hypothetical protein
LEAFKVARILSVWTVIHCAVVMSSNIFICNLRSHVDQEREMCLI